MTITQTSKDKNWVDESGMEIPFNRINAVEKLHERHSATILKKALVINQQLADFKVLVQKLCGEAFEAFMASKDVKKETKGNFTWFNFNRSIKIEVNQSTPLKFDDLTITAAKTKLDEFLTNNIESKNDFVKNMVMDAFETQRNNQLDVKKVMGLTRYKSKINDPLFSEAVDLISEAIRRSDTKTYFRIWQKDADGKYQNIDLNLSSI